MSTPQRRTIDSIFRIYSMTKLITSVAAMILVDAVGEAPTVVRHHVQDAGGAVDRGLILSPRIFV